MELDVRNGGLVEIAKGQLKGVVGKLDNKVNGVVTINCLNKLFKGLIVEEV